jgi:hypothetical protein
LIRRVLGGAITRRLGQWLPQSIYIGGDGGSRLTAGGVVLAQEAFESERPRGLEALRRFVTPRASRCVKLGGGLALL